MSSRYMKLRANQAILVPMDETCETVTDTDRTINAVAWLVRNMDTEDSLALIERLAKDAFESSSVIDDYHDKLYALEDTDTLLKSLAATARANLRKHIKEGTTPP